MTHSVEYIIFRFQIKNIKANSNRQEIFENTGNHEIFFINYTKLGREIENVKKMLEGSLLENSNIVRVSATNKTGIEELIKEIGSGDKVLAYGKAAVVGLSGELEHASAFIHTLRFGNKFRDAVGGTSYLSFTNTRGPAGCKISIPMMHKTDAGLRP